MTTGGSTSGRWISASRSALPQKSRRASSHATAMPIGVDTSVATTAPPPLRVAILDTYRGGRWTSSSDFTFVPLDGRLPGTSAEILDQEIAKAENVDLTENHWEVVNFLRQYYDEYQIAPAVRVLTKAIGKQLGEDKGNSKYLYELFPYGPAKQACKIAGLPKPTGCV